MISKEIVVENIIRTRPKEIELLSRIGNEFVIRVRY